MYTRLLLALVWSVVAAGLWVNRMGLRRSPTISVAKMSFTRLAVPRIGDLVIAEVDNEASTQKGLGLKVNQHRDDHLEHIT